jgi:hypothetical protein
VEAVEAVVAEEVNHQAAGKVVCVRKVASRIN